MPKKLPSGQAHKPDHKNENDFTGNIPSATLLRLNDVPPLLHSLNHPLHVPIDPSP